MLPFRRFVRFISSSDDVLSGSASRSPITMASENEVFACSLEIFSKTSVKRPETAPVTIL